MRDDALNSRSNDARIDRGARNRAPCDPTDVSAITTKSDEDASIARLVARELTAILPPDRPGGAAIAIHLDGRTLFFNQGFADAATKRAVTSDSLFNLASIRKLFETTLLAQAARNGTISLADPVAKYVTELQQGGDIRRVTLGELATHTSGLLLRPDYPPWPVPPFTLESFFTTLNAWTADEQHAPGKQHIYTHAALCCCTWRSTARSAPISTRRYGKTCSHRSA